MQNNNTDSASLRLAEMEDLEIALGLIEQGKAFLKSQGIDQWQNGYPDEACITADIANGKGYFLCCGERIVGYMCVDFDGEPAYEGLQGEWLCDLPYVVVHRMVIDNTFKSRGLASEAFRLVQELAQQRGIRSFRVDTDADNKIMQHLLAKNGFRYCGIINFDNSEKIAFEKMLTEAIHLEKLTRQVCQIAREVGRFLVEERRNFRSEAVQTKQAHDYVSYVDKESERRIVTALRELLPQAGFIAEEGSAAYHEEPYCWVVDPLDGTTNFIHDYAPYCVSIALRDKENLLLGVVYDPTSDECFHAWKDGGAWLNDQPLKVSAVESMENAFLALELPYNSDGYAHTAIHLLRELYGRVGGIRMNGSAALALCYVAAGRFDGWLEAFICPWDYSAGALIVREAGGRISDFHGSADINSHHIVATNGPLHNTLLSIVQEAMPKF